MTRLGVVLFAALLVLVWPVANASAQYPPPPADTVLVSVSNAAPPINSRVTITWSAGDAGACVPTIVAQPGSDAVLESVTAGSAVLFTGSTAGTIEVTISCPGGGEASIAVAVGSSPAITISLLTDAPAPASEAGAASADRSVTSLALGSGAAAVAAVALAAFWRRGRTRRDG